MMILVKFLVCLFFFLIFKACHTSVRHLYKINNDAFSVLEGRIDYLEDQLEMMREAVK